MNSNRDTISWPNGRGTLRLFARPGRPDALVHADRIVFGADLVFLRVKDDLVVLQPPACLERLPLDLFLAKAEGLRRVLAGLGVEAIVGTDAQLPRHRWAGRNLRDRREFGWNLLRSYLCEGFARRHPQAMEDLATVVRHTEHADHVWLFRDLQGAASGVAQAMAADGIDAGHLPRLPEARAFFAALGRALRAVGQFPACRLPPAVEEVALFCLVHTERARAA
jgi:hypothetical protein